ncbi:Hypothetical protein, putative [Bodo saltans]|uniref:Uncharacterized protein n=1 Tax=Bodo saltans TaxID=75058 RepID=A0A0S4JUC7_BODSA|nr:Hypothetical protein, putative [Bodo saltans]|eukprot:CUG94414.1 Hypothetical protein, putative [Bodo saltans]
MVQVQHDPKRDTLDSALTEFNSFHLLVIGRLVHRHAKWRPMEDENKLKQPGCPQTRQQFPRTLPPEWSSMHSFRCTTTMRGRSLARGQQLQSHCGNNMI